MDKWSLRELLVPRPQRLELTGRSTAAPPRVTIGPQGTDPLIDTASSRLREMLLRWRLSSRVLQGAPADEVFVHLEVDTGLSLPAQGYRLTINPQGVRVRGVDAAGVFYGVATLTQILAIQQGLEPSGPLRLPDVEISDWPSFPVRGVCLDISRDRVPTMATLFELVDRLSGWKINQLQLYTEHAFAYEGHEVVWERASPMTCAEMRALDVYCRERAVELVPNQNSFGHLHRWLVHEPYRSLAECPEGIRHPFSEEPEPFSLCPTDAAVLDFLADLYDQLLPCFSSSLFNVGLDETLDLGKGRSASACAKIGRPRVYLDFLHRVHDLVHERQRRMQFWADILIRSPELLDELPSDVVALEWGYEADHPFRQHLRTLGVAGLDLYACPGTSSWNSLAGRTDNAVLNLANAAASGLEAGATGYLITDWGDFGHLQPMSVSYLGLLTGAGLSWNVATAGDDRLAAAIPEWLDLHVFEQPGLGKIAYDLGNVYRRTGAEIRNGSVLFFLLVSALQGLDQPRFRDLTLDGLSRARRHTEDALGRLERVHSAAPETELATRELRWVGQMLRFACELGSRRLQLGRERPLAALTAASKDRLRRELEPLIAEYGALWRARSRPGGFSDSVRRLERIQTLLR